MIRKHLVMSVMIAMVLLVVAFIPFSNQAGTYDPWSDVNSDGKMDGRDIAYTAAGFGTLGDPTRYVTVTNWPVERALYSEELILRGTCYYWKSASLETRDLLDGTITPISQYLVHDDKVTRTVSQGMNLIYNYTYIYQKIPTRSYQILGTPIVTLTWNVSSSLTNCGLGFYAYLGKVSMDGQWTELAYLGVWSQGTGSGPYLVGGCSIRDLPVNVIVNADERLAIRILAYFAVGPVGDYSVTLTLFGKNTDNFIVDIPIVRNP